MTTISIDFETRSTVDLRKTGVYPYAAHPDTDVWCMAYAFDDGEPDLWVPGLLCPFRALPHDDFSIQPGDELRAWNAQFERIIWNTIMVPRYGFPEAPLEMWVDTAAEAAAMALPRNLSHAAEVLGITEQKDMEGHALMMRMAKPRSTKGGEIVWWEVPERRERLYAYCKQDVRTEQAIAKAVRPLGRQERKIYLLDQRINDRGVMIDVPLVKAAQGIVAEGLRRANEAVRDATGGAVTSVSKTADLRDWVNETTGANIDSVRKSVVQEMLEGDLPTPARAALEARAEAGRSSVAKLTSMIACKCSDDRARGLLFYHAARTGRWAGKLIQPQNFPRGDVPSVERFIGDTLRGDYDYIDLFHPPLAVVSSMLRAMLRAAPGHRLMVGDFAQIEARVLVWLADQRDVLQQFARGEPVYEIAAARFGGTRQHGKAQVLGCGYGMGWEKFIQAAKEMFGLDLDKELAQTIVGDYRDTNKDVVQLWWDIGDAAMNAVRAPGSVHTVKGCTFCVRGAYLWLILPSGRPLVYAAPKIAPRKTPWGEGRDSVLAWGLNSMTRKWERRALYGGLLVENIVQALSRDLMASAMLRLEGNGYPVILTVHDEIVCEVPNTVGTLNEFTNAMSAIPVWAKGCPVEVESWEGERYRK
jgi:DNA polymerase